jgi:DNA invertase Pin-like site-specific DNA recombinase
MENAGRDSSIMQSTTRCAIYTRKSSEEGLEQAFNSLQAQREACESYINSQRHEGWSIIPTHFDDGGYSGGTLERPALRSLLAAIKDGQVDVVVVYKIDRLTRSLFDFAKIVEIFDAQHVSFVSVTQAFNTTTSMGRLTLNVLLSFAQFEREVTGERIRDKVAASKKKGMWMGGNIPLGYDLSDRKLVINAAEAETVRLIFELYCQLGAVRKVKAELDRLSKKTKPRGSDKSGRRHTGLPFQLGHLYTILRSPLYIGRIHHKGQSFAGEHPPIIDSALWERVQLQLENNAVERRSGLSAAQPSLLVGLLYDGNDRRMTPSHAVKNGKRYRYYLSNSLISGRDSKFEGLRLPAFEVESHVVAIICRFLSDTERLISEIYPDPVTPDTLVKILHEARMLGERLAIDGGVNKYQIIRQLISRVQVCGDGIHLELKRWMLRRQLESDPPDIGVTAEKNEGTIILSVKAELRQLGKEKRLILTKSSSHSNPDPALIKALTRAHEWFESLKNGKAETIAEIARYEKLSRSYVSMLIPLAFLAPDITEAIFAGRQPAGLNLDRLLKLKFLPLEWAAQRKALGVAG